MSKIPFGAYVYESSALEIATLSKALDAVQKMLVVDIDGGMIVCAWMRNGKVHEKAFYAAKLEVADYED